MRACSRSALAAATIAVALIAPAVASAAAPGATTGGAAQVTITTATLTGTVNPHGVSTTYYFQYGTTTAYGSRTPSTGVGGGTNNVPAARDDGGAGANPNDHQPRLHPKP